MNHLFRALIVVGIGVFAQGCVVHSHGARRVVTEETVYVDDGGYDYRYSGYHPIPHSHGGGWCNLTHLHVHGYEPGIGYAYHHNYWVYSRPRVVYYFGGHYDSHGRFCNHRGRHSHDYLPSTHAASAYNWDSRRNGYVYTPSRDRSVRTSPRVAPPSGRAVSGPSNVRDDNRARVRSSPSSAPSRGGASVGSPAAPPARSGGSVSSPSAPGGRGVGGHQLGPSAAPVVRPESGSAPSGVGRGPRVDRTERVPSAPPPRSERSEAPAGTPRERSAPPARSERSAPSVERSAPPARSAPSVERSAPAASERVSSPSRSAPAPSRAAPRSSPRTR